MAKSLKKENNPSSENVSAKHNVADLNALIRDCAQQMRSIKEQRKELNEEAAGIRERLRNAGVQVAAFDFSLRVSDMEQQARNGYLDSLRINFEALSIGQQSDMFDTSSAAA